MNYFEKYRARIREVLDETLITDARCEPLDPEEGIAQWSAKSRATVDASGHHFFAGNGASAMMASHMAIDCTKNAGFNATAFNDAAMLTAVGNDIGYDSVFAYPLQRYSKPGDLLVTISSSGSSPNIIKALKTAKEMGLTTVTLSGMRTNNPCRDLGDINIWVPGRTYGIVECAHQVILHCWLDHYMDIRDWDETGFQTADAK